MSTSAASPRDFTVRLRDGRSMGIVSVGRDDAYSREAGSLRGENTPRL